MILLQAKHLSKAFPIEGSVFRQRIGSVQALWNVSLDLHAGDVLALVGGSGSGKSTLAKIVAGLLSADSGTILWEDHPLQNFSRLERAHHIQMIFQDPYASLNPKLSVGTQLAEVVRISNFGSRISDLNPKSEVRNPRLQERCIELLKSVGLSADALSHYPFQFSGGQRQRIAIARALAMQPELLIADEPLSALDVTTQVQILDLFEQLKKEFRLTVLFITHDLAIARRFSDRVVVLQDGQVVEEGSASAVLKVPKHPYTKALLEAIPKILC